MNKSQYYLLILVSLFLLPINALAQQTYDLWQYMFNNHYSYLSLTGAPFSSHDMRTMLKPDPIYGQKLVLIKNRSGYPYEVFFNHNGNIYLKYESGGYVNPNTGSWTNDFSRNNYRYYDGHGFVWAPRYVTNNQVYEIPAYWEFYVNEDHFPGNYKKKICAGWVRAVHKTNVHLGGQLGTRTDVIELNRYWKLNQNGYPDENNKEKYFYDNELGLVLWQWIINGQIYNSTFFNNYLFQTFSESGPWPSSSQNHWNFTNIPGCQ